MNIIDLREAQAIYEDRMEEIIKSKNDLYQYRSSFTKLFNRTGISNMLIDDYTIGKKKSNFCYALERELGGLGLILGSNAFKFGIYYGETKKDKNRKYRFTKKLGDTYEEAFENIKKSILELLDAGENGNNDIIIKNKLSPMFKGKILSTYFPEKYLNIFSMNHLDFFLTQLDLDNKSLIKSHEVIKREALMDFKNQDEIMKEWTVDQFTDFLYTQYPGKPPRKGELTNDSLKKRADYRMPTFSVNPVPEFIELEVLNPKKNAIHEKSKINNTQLKINYEKEARKLRKLGDRGEKIVFEIEKKQLIEAGKIELAEKVERVSLKSDAIGYDILSFETDGTERYIEVKATTSKVGNANFFLTINELNTAKKHINYYVYIVYDITSDNPKIWPIKNPFSPEDKKIVLKPIKYRVTINTKK